ncbi:MAG: GTP 3',8-cyclase MoaA [Desulfobulbaceae bacterium]|nr:GTP 3',8-cyclase MoaA [Desulfobulbaceae bacterium]
MTAHQQGTTVPYSPPPQSNRLIDNHGRPITYLRLSITDRCNLRCHYCMPEGGADFVPHAEILTFEELERVVRLLSALGVSKVRITGGEPFVRQGCMSFLQRLRGIDTVRSLHVTTNGVETFRYLDDLAALRINGVNLSLDSLDPGRFWQISRRNLLHTVLSTLDGCLKRSLPLKINAVVQEDTEDSEIVALADLARQHPLCLRFIEKMPFSGVWSVRAKSTRSLRQRLHVLFPEMTPLVTNGPSTARLYTLPGYAGQVGVIEGNSRRFCTTCNKIRITPVGMLKACLYDNGVLDLKAMLRRGADDSEITQAVIGAVAQRYRDGMETEEHCARECDPAMASIGG